MDRLSKSVVMVSQRPSLICFSCVSTSCSAIFCRSCRRTGIKGHLPAICITITSELSGAHWANEIFIPWGGAGVLNAPHKFHFCVNCVDVREVCRPWKVKSAVLRLVVASRSP
jgi:hypothetical protein